MSYLTYSTYLSYHPLKKIALGLLVEKPGGDVYLEVCVLNKLILNPLPGESAGRRCPNLGHLYLYQKE